MYRRRVFVRVGVAVVLACSLASCDSGSPPAKAARAGPAIAGVTFPALDPVDSGVMQLGPVVHDVDSSDRGKTAESGLRYGIESCQLRAPESWVVRGTVTLPRGQKEATGVLSVGLLAGDVGVGGPSYRVTITASGRFAVAFTAPRERSGYFDDSFSTCEVELLRSSVPVAPDERQPPHHARASAQAKPYVYTARAGSLQALGIGARLGDRSDPRTVSLYTIWSGQTSSLDRAYVPEINGEVPALAGLRTSKKSPCTAIDVSVLEIAVTTARDCEAPGEGVDLELTTLAVRGAPGFVWARHPDASESDVAVRRSGSIEVTVFPANGTASRQEIERVAASLVTRRNLARGKQRASRRATTLDEAVARFRSEHPGVTERARFRYRQWWMLALEGNFEADSSTAWTYTFVQARKLSSGWWIANGGGGAGSEVRCFSGPIYLGGGDDSYTFAITGDRAWGIEGDVNGVWRRVATTNGVAFVDQTIEGVQQLPVKLRPVDQSGRIPACFARENAG